MNVLDLKYEKYKLENGLEVILYNNKHIPLTAVNIWYKTGSAYEKKGKTGLAHLFEHMMFQGSQNVPKEMHFRFIQEAGGSLNGSTSFDRTNFYEKVPSNFLELVLWLESDRMGFLLPALTKDKLTNQIDVVRNERIERYDNQPYGLAWEILLRNLYPEGHPYNWPTIGSLDDINSYTIEDVTDFYQKYYSPSNSSMVIAGDFDISSAKKMVEQYFGDLQNIQQTPVFNECALTPLSHKVIEHREDVQLSRIYMAWHTTKIFTDDDVPLEVLADILAGSKSSRLYKELVYEKELAQDISVYQFSGKFAGHFLIAATAKPGVEVDLIKSEMLRIVEEVKKNGITSAELQKSKNSIKSSFIYSMQNIDSLADQLNYYNYFLNEPASFISDLARYDRLKEDTIQNVAASYLNENFVELRIFPDSKE